MKLCDFEKDYCKKKDIRCYHCGIPLVGNGFWDVFDANGKLHSVCNDCADKHQPTQEDIARLDMEAEVLLREMRERGEL